MPISGPVLRPVSREELEAVLPLVAAYQRFYGVDAPDDERNRSFWSRFTAPDGDRGVLLAAWDGARALGFTTVYWSWESVAARDIAVMNDLYVAEDARGAGVGQALVDAALAAARTRGMGELSWVTALDNRRAQRLYETYGASRTAWFEYSIELSNAPGRT